MTRSTNLPISLAIIEDNRFTRDGLSLLLQREVDFQLLGSYASCEDALADPGFPLAQLVLLDLRLPGLSGRQAVHCLLRQFPHFWIVITTAYEDEKEIFHTIAAGAVGFVSKKTSPAELLAALRNVASGGSPMTPDLARQILQRMEKFPLWTNIQTPALTTLQHNILQRLALGESYRTVARSLRVSEEAVFQNLRAVYYWIHHQFNKTKDLEEL